MSRLFVQTELGISELARLQVVFSKTDDRWSHAIQLCVDGVIEPIASSVEGSTRDDWPSSPPVQELAEHKIGNDSVLLGVGMAGSSHWSISASVDDSKKVLLDLACLANKKPVGWVGSTYQVADKVLRDTVSETGIRLNVNGWLVEFTAVAEQEWSSSISMEGNRMTIFPSPCSVHAPHSNATTGPNSTRWGLRVGSSEKQPPTPML